MWQIGMIKTYQMGKKGRIWNYVHIKPETIKLPEENIGGKLPNIGLSNDFSGIDTKSTGNNSKSKHVGLHHTKKFLHNKGTINKWKGNLRNGRKYLQIIYMKRG